jgi:hypothetical protein
VSAATLKPALAAYLAAVSGIGTIDTVRMDPDDVPRKINQRVGQPYWVLEIRDNNSRPASFGTPGTRNLFGRYSVRLEGWQGFAGTEEQTAAWDALVAAIEDRIEAINLVPSPLPLPELQAMENSRTSDQRVVGLALQGASTPLRAHHALITFEIVTFETVTG